MGLVSDEIVFDVLEHHVEAIFDVVLCSTRHLLDDLRPLITNAEPSLQNEDVLFKREWILFNFRIQKINPALPTLFSIAVRAKACVEGRRNLAPLARAVLPNEPDQLFVFTLNPVALMNGRLFVLVELVHALAVVPTRNKTGYLHPVISVELRRLHVFTGRIILYGPNQQPRLVRRPVLFSRVGLLVL